LSAESLDHPQAAWPFDSYVLRAPRAEWVCLGCHDEPRGEAVAVKVHGGACFLCHDPHREPLTRPADCALCHDLGLEHGARGSTLAQTCMKCHAPHHVSQDASNECAKCHGKQRGEAQVTTRALTKDHPSCGTCHVPHGFTKDVVVECTSCHAPHGKQPDQRAACLSCHEDMRAHEPQAKRCSSCHLFAAGEGAPGRPKSTR
jgi:hypothetical protein